MTQEIRLGHSPLSDSVYAGRLTKDGKKWKGKKYDVTNDFIGAAISRWNGFVETFTAPDGKKYEISVKEVKP